MPTPLNNVQPTIAFTESVTATGIFPTTSGDPGADYTSYIHMFAGGYLIGEPAADGALLPLNQNAALFSLVGTTYGGDGRNTLGLPNLSGRVAIGAGGPLVLGAQVGATQVTLSATPPIVGQLIDNRQPSTVIGFGVRTSGTVDEIGQIVEYATNSFRLPDGVVPLQGQLLSIAQNQALFSAIGATFGGDGVLTFGLPDLRGKSLIGASATLPAGSLVGSDTLTLSQSNLPTSLGGSGAPIDNRSASVAVNFVIAVNGLFPSRGGNETFDGSDPVLGEVRATLASTGWINNNATGWALAQGQALSTNANAALYAVLGNTYGGDSHAFNLPDTQGRVVVGAGAGAAGPVAGGAASLTLSAQQIPNLPPVIGLPGAQTGVGADQHITFSAAAGDAITVSDVDSASVSVTIAAAGVLTPGSTQTGVTVTGAGTNVLIVSGSPSAVTTALDGLSFKPTGPAGQAGATLSVSAFDGQASTSGAIQLNLLVTTAPTGVSVTGLANGFVATSTPSVKGAAAANAVIHLYDGGVLVGSATADAQGAFTVSPSTALADGAHTLTVTATAGALESAAVGAPSLTVDTTPPAAPVLTLTNGALLATTTPNVTGTAEAYASVKVYEGATLLATATADASGHWSATTSSLAQGAHSLSARATDVAGNTGPTSNSVTITVDTAPPAAPVLLSGFGAIVPTVTPTLTGTAEAGSTVRVSEGATVVGVTQADAQGRWSLTTSALAQGGHTLGVSATDAAGNTSTSTSAGLTVDTVPPAAPSLTSGLGPVASTTPLVGGSAEANAVVRVYEGTTLLAATTASAGGAWSVRTSTLSQGAHTLTATAVDAAGNVGPTSAGAVVTVDTTPPAAPVVAAPTPGFVATTTPTLSGTAEANAAIRVVDGAAVIAATTADGSGAWSVATSALTQGAHTLAITAADAAGNVGAAANLALTVDTVPPGLPTVVTPTSGYATTVTPTLTGTAEASAIVRILQGASIIASTTADNSGHWSAVTSALAQGPQSLSIQAVDAAGNVSPSATAAFTVDSIAPAPPSLSAPASAFVATTTPNVSGTAEAGATVRVYEGSTLLATASANGSGAWSTAASPLAQGAHNLTATATDAAGNTSSVSSSVSLTVDTTAPTASIAPAIGGASNATTLTEVVTFSEAVTGLTASALALRNAAGAVVGGAVVGTPVSADGGRTWNVTVSNVTADGSVHLDLVDPSGVRDLAGNPLAAGVVGASSTLDHTSPQVLAITPASPSAVNTSTLVELVTFSEAVTGVSASAFVVHDAAGVVPGAVIGTPTSSDGGRTYSVTISGLTQSGAIHLDLAGGATGIVDHSGNALAGGGFTGGVTQVSQPAALGGASSSVTSPAGGATALQPSVVVSDSSPLLTVKVAITSGFVTGDRLTIASLPTGVSASFDASAGVLTLAGSATDAAYQAALRTLAFVHDGVASAGSRTIALTLTDAAGAVAQLSETVTISAYSPPGVVTPSPTPMLPSYLAGLDVQTTNLLRALPTDVSRMDATTSLGGQAQSASQIAAKLDAGQLTLPDALSQLYHAVDGTVSVAEITYAFFTGRTPTAAGLDYLVHSAVNTTDLSDPYYAPFSTENRYINFAANLGRFGSGTAAFHAVYDNLSLADATARAYQSLFGAPASADKVAAILNTLVPDGLGGQETRAQYFAGYGTDGLTGIGTKSAMIGWLMADSVKEGFGTYQQANLHFLQDLGHGTAAYNVDLLLTYGSAPTLVGQPVLTAIGG